MAFDRRTAAREFFGIIGVLAGAITLVILVITANSWFYSPWFWGALLLAAVTATLVYARRHPPQVTAAGRTVPTGHVVALRCVLNVLAVAALRHLVLALEAHSHDIPFWLLVETFAVPGLALGWMSAPAAVEAALFAPPNWSGLQRIAAEDLILPIVQGVYVLYAGSAFVALLLVLPHLRWLPGWGVLAGAWLGGAVFGFFMADAFVSLPPVKPLFEAAPVNGATGVRVSNMDVLVPYAVVAVLGGMLRPVLDVARHRNGLPPIHILNGLVWVPVILAMLMAAALLWAHRTRDPAEGERERSEAEASYREAVAGNAERRADLLACAGLVLAAWEHREEGGKPWMTADVIQRVGARLWGRGISFPLPDSEALMTAGSYLLYVLRAAEAGASSVEGDPPSLLLFWRKAPVLSWEEAIALVADLAARLCEGRSMDDPRLLRFLGQRPAQSEKVPVTGVRNRDDV